MIALLILLLFGGLAAFMLVFGLPLYCALLVKTKVAACKDDSIVTYPLA
ncbi:MAG: hypothetical protein HY053_05630 [Proteobacteria bacterium]|nr:hypothetical protein [Pseudomonadota bacterium]